MSSSHRRSGPVRHAHAAIALARVCKDPAPCNEMAWPRRRREGPDASEGMVSLITPEGYLNPWIPILILPAIIGIVCAYLLQPRTAIIVGGAVPFVGFLAVLLWSEYVQPPAGGGASMWPIALLIGGTVVAFVGGFAAWCVWEVRRTRRPN